ncbi:MAG: DEAD/DEAH box helicase [Acholeplasmatales bacterium]|nr:DEAD/DEAH box helicase [Acholeplasmatales bacterium]
MQFDGYELKDYIVRALKDLKFESFTDVQKSVFEELKTEKNILAKSKTGSGKTHAFLIPIFNDLDEDKEEVFSTIIAPTKELAQQIYKMAQHIASFCPKAINIKLFISGTDREREIAKLNNKNPQIVIGTPGKIKDLAIDNNVLKIYTSKYLIVDEVDMTFESGFIDEVDSICNVIDSARFMFFSATMREEILPFLKKYMTNVSLVDIKNTNDNKIEHIWLPLKHKERLDVLEALLKNINPYLCIIFVNKKENVNNVVSRLNSLGYFVGSMHGDLTSRERKRVLEDAKKLKYQYIVATDLAARGIDIQGVSHIINFELPGDYEFYLHRSGRTGRMYSDGIVYSFYEDLDDEYLDFLNKKGIKPKYYEIKGGELVEYKGRNTRQQRVKPTTNYELEASKYIPKSNKVKPGYKKKRQAQIDDLAKRLKKNDQKKKKRRTIKK